MATEREEPQVDAMPKGTIVRFRNPRLDRRVVEGWVVRDEGDKLIVRATHVAAVGNLLASQLRIVKKIWLVR